MMIIFYSIFFFYFVALALFSACVADSTIFLSAILPIFPFLLFTIALNTVYRSKKNAFLNKNLRQLKSSFRKINALFGSSKSIQSFLKGQAIVFSSVRVSKPRKTTYLEKMRKDYDAWNISPVYSRLSSNINRSIFKD